MIDESEITRVLKTFEAFMAKPDRDVRCQICLHPNRMLYNRAILDKTKNDAAIGRELNLDTSLVRHHRLTCLVRRGGAKPMDVASPFTRNQQNHFPMLASERTQKRWLLNELLALRDEAQNKKPPDRKELFRLAKAIDQAAKEYRAAKLAKKNEAPKETEEVDLDLSDAQKAEMERVNRKETNGADTNRPLS